MKTAPPADKPVNYTPSLSEGNENCAPVKAPVSAPESCLTCVSLSSDFSRGLPPVFSSAPPGEDDEVQTETQDDPHFFEEVGRRSVNLPKDVLCEEHDEQDALLLYQNKLKAFYTHKFKPGLKGELQSQINSRLYLTEETPQQQDSPLHSSDLFRPTAGAGAAVRGWCPGTVLTVGEAGVGKSLLLQCSLLDWCEGTALEDVQIIALLSFSELNLLQNQSRTVQELLEVSCPGLSRSGLMDLSQLKLLLMLDALDECLLPLDFSSQLRCSDVSKSMPVETLVTHLLKGDLLPNAQLWITSRPTAASSIPPTLIHRATELRGFTDHHKEAYFLQHLQDESLRAQLRSCAPVYSLCRLPLVCSIITQLCEKTNTRVTHKQMFVHLLTHHMKKMQQRYGLHQTQVHRVLLALSRLAWEQLQGGHLTFCEEELEACGVEVKEAVVYSGLCTQVSRGGSCGVQRSFSFVHPSVQEGLASLFLYEKICSDPNRSINLLHLLNQMIQEETQRPNQDQDSEQDQDQNQDQDQDQDQDQTTTTTKTKTRTRTRTKTRTWLREIYMSNPATTG
ncbi:protein NLRC3-like isoform X2 [Boleophthalmus pectinirostris]|uniref:protein NLRC3-like isoform X2 n=1 Tax=Boleophthalmus pectinirostris TaxID=150288 RepID=UPI00242F94B2|nr:protein NLRC3-like isoform X2 [Boleophthalmus pectinirostris]